MTWNCEQIEARLSDYADRLLQPDELKYFEAHTASCAKCAAVAALMTGLLSRMHQLEPEAVPAGLERRIVEQTLGPQKKKTGWRGWLAWLAPVMSPRFAYGAVTLLVTMAVLSQALGIDVRQVQLRDLYPANMYRSANRKANLMYARGAKFVTDLRVVYEIQSRLRPEPEQPAPAEQQPAPGKSEGPDKKSEEPRQQNRADENYRNYSLLAFAAGFAPGRSN